MTGDRMFTVCKQVKGEYLKNLGGGCGGKKVGNRNKMKARKKRKKKVCIGRGRVYWDRKLGYRHLLLNGGWGRNVHIHTWESMHDTTV